MSEETVNLMHPFACPICGGNGLVARGFYNQTSGFWSTTDATPEKCRSCNGSGIVWGLPQDADHMLPRGL